MPYYSVNIIFIKNTCLLVIFTNPSTLEGYDTRSIFKRSLTGLNSKFSFSKTGCLKNLVCPTIYP